MNRAYRTVWSEARKAWIAAPECARGRGKGGGAVLAAGLAAFQFGLVAHADPLPNELPTGGQVTAGAATIAQSGATLDILQSTQNVAIDWASFSIGSQAAVNFVQPSASAIALNRVLGQDASQIFGQLNANGQVFILNPNGVLFGRSAQVDVGGLVASTRNLGDDDFMAGNYRFDGNGAGAVVNEGSIRAAGGGYVALIGAQVSNTGDIATPDGAVVLAAGDAVSVTLDNGHLAGFAVERGALQALAGNNGLIRAEGGRVYMTAAALDSLTQAVVNNEGIVEAHRVQARGGVIVLDSGEGGYTRTAGLLDASSADGQGGRIVATGGRVLVDDGARLDATGRSGGGGIHVGGGWQGGDPAIRQATGTVVMAGATLDASATDNGDGGTVVAWSDIHDANSVTRAYGTFLARGGANGGNGGRIETSGHWLDTAGVRGDAASPLGTAGMWLFDPYSVTITTANANGSFGSAGGTDTWTPSATGSTILNTDINAKLEAGTNVTITTGAAGAEIGDITVASAITKSAGNTDVTLTLRAANSIVVDQAISNTGGTGKLHVSLDADNDNGTRDGGGVILLNSNITTGGGDIQFGTGATLNLNGVTTKVGGDVYVGGGAAQTLTTGGGSVTFNGEVILANTNGLSIGTSNGNVTFGGLLNSGNSYASVNSAGDWTSALSAAQSGTGTAVGDTYLATITSRLENAIASRAVNYQSSWLGGRRVTGLGTNSAWRWVAGPEGSMDSGNGLVFFTQNGSDSANGSGGTTAAGLYSNWNSGEPNNSGGANLAAETESALQFTGNLGQWNDLPKTGNSLNYYVREANLAASPLTINAGTGTVTFTGAVGGSKALASLNVTAATIAIDGGAVTTEGVQTYTGNVTLGAASTVLTQTNANTDFTLLANRSITNASGGNASLTIKTTRDILLKGGSSITSTTGTLGVTLNARAGDGASGAIVFNDDESAAVSIRSNGGSINLVGGSTGTGYAIGGSNSYAYSADAHQDGIAMQNATLDSRVYVAGTPQAAGGGAITLKGKGYDANITKHGGGLWAKDSAFHTGGGALAIDGWAQRTGSPTTGGVRYGAYLDTVGITTNGGSIDITTPAPSADTGLYLATATSATMDAGAGAATLTTDKISISGTEAIQGSGTLTIKPYTNSTTIGLGTGAGTLSLPQSYFWNGSSGVIKNGFSSITIGSASQTGAISVNGLAFSDPLTLMASGAGGSISLAGTVGDGSGSRAASLSLIADGSIAGAANITTNDQALLIDTASGTGTLSGVIALGTGGLTKQGAGTTVLSGANTYTGTTAVSAGTLGVANAAGLGGTAGGTTVANGATLDLQSVAIGAEGLTLNGGTLKSSVSSSLAGNISLAAGSTVQTDDTLVLSGIVSGAGTLTKTGSNVLELTGNNTYSGATAVNAGYLKAGHANALGTTANGTTLAAGTYLDLNGVAIGAEAITTSGAATIRALSGSGSSSLAGDIGLGGTGTLTVDGTQLTLSGIVSGGFGLTKNGAGIGILSGNNTYTGSTLVTAGTLTAAHANALGGTAGSTTVIGGTLKIDGVSVGNESVTIAGSGVGNAGALQGNGTASLSGTLTVSGGNATVGGSGSLTLGTVSITDGRTLTLGTGGALNFTTGAISGVAGGTSSNLTVNTTGSATLGTVGTDINAVNIAARNTTLGAVTANTIGVTDTGSNGVTLNGVLTANANNDANALVIVTNKFTNVHGAGALSTPNGTSRWQVWSVDPLNDSHNGMAADFEQYSSTYGVTAIPGAGNGYLYSVASTAQAQAASPSVTSAIISYQDQSTSGESSAGQPVVAGNVVESGERMTVARTFAIENGGLRMPDGVGIEREQEQE